jgi:transposase
MRYELSDDEWTAIKPMLSNKPRGIRRVNDRRVLNGIFWVLRSGTPCHEAIRPLLDVWALKSSTLEKNSFRIGDLFVLL